MPNITKFHTQTNQIGQNCPKYEVHILKVCIITAKRLNNVERKLAEIDYTIYVPSKASNGTEVT
jgi:metal-dependent amidase/aminoacylase/carboxypeptidase family protein